MDNRKYGRKVVLVLIDIVLVNISYIAAFYFRFMHDVPYELLLCYENNFIIITGIYISSFFLFKLYDNLWNYASIDEFILAVGSSIMSNILSIVYSSIIGIRLPYSVSVLAGIFCVLLIGGFRMSFRIYGRYSNLFGNKDVQRKKVMIIGAGSAGNMIIKEMKKSKDMYYEPVALIDDNKYKVGKIISGIKVFGTRKDIIKVAKEKDIDIILIAIPSICNEDKKEILGICKMTGCIVKLIPGIYEIINGKASLKELRDVNMEDLLGREPVKLDMEGIKSYIKNRVIMITGGGGSIGSELCRQIIKFEPKQVVIVDNYENNVYELQQEFNRNKINSDIKYIIASVRDKNKLEIIFDEFKPEIVFHAAAHKHVPLMEENPAEAIKNNIFGTLNLAECADKFNVKRFVMISTDKAVNPTNIMGATKRACEMIIQSMDSQSDTQFSAVRFGNVLGSNGSVVPLFIKQIQNGGPVTVTHREINRFFMTIPEAAQLVLQAAAYAGGGEIFALDMESPIKIYDLACDLIRLSGLIPNKDIEIEFIGLRPGEKLYEEVLTAEEGLRKTAHNKIFVGRPTFNDFDALMRKIYEFKDIIHEDNREKIISKLEELVPTYTRSKNEEVAASIEIKG